MESLLSGLIDGTVAPGDFVLRYRIGDAFSGETSLDLTGDGEYEVGSTATEGRRERSYRGRLPAGDVQELARALQAARVWETRHVRDKPREDDPTATLSVAAAGREAEVSLWVSEIARVPPFAEAQDAVLDLVRRVSGGEVLETGR